MKNKKLKRSFNLAAAAALAPFTTLITGRMFKEDEISYPSVSEEPLTRGEVAVIRSIFGNEINTGKVRKYSSPRKSADAIAQAFGSDKIKFYNSAGNTDYSATNDILKFGIFVHEMTHIWQFQCEKVSTLSHAIGEAEVPRYSYSLQRDSRLRDFGVEQQASMIEDYARLFLFKGETRSSYWIKGGDTWDNLYRLQKVVEDRFPEARKTRLARETKRTLARNLPVIAA